MVPVLVLAAACGSDVDVVQAGDSTDSSGAAGSAVQDAPVILATTGIWADVVDNLACNGGATVEVIIPDGADPHGFEPSLADRAAMDRATLIVANGLGLEEGLLDTLEAVEGEGVAIVRVAEHVDPIVYQSISGAQHDDHDDHAEGEDHDDHAEGEDHDDHSGHAHEEGGLDPHVWFDPQRVSAAAEHVADALVAHAGLDRAEVDDCVARYRDELQALDAEVEAQIEAIAAEDRLLVTNHDALGYYADRYGFEVLGTVLPTPSGLAASNPAQLEALAQLIIERGVPAIFAETQHSAEDAEALADRIGEVKVVTLQTGSLGPADTGTDSYVGLIRSTTDAIVDALDSARG